MKKSLISTLGILAVAVLSGCGTATYQQKGESFAVSGTSYDPEFMASTLANNEVKLRRARGQERLTESQANINDAVADGVRNGRYAPMYGMGAGTGFSSQYLCRRGACLHPPAATAVPGARAPEAPASKATDGEAPAKETAPAAAPEAGVSPEEFEKLKREAAVTKAKTDALLDHHRKERAAAIEAAKAEGQPTASAEK